jgi:predicted TIM-barrel fold metal-dependent hydrolase
VLFVTRPHPERATDLASFRHEMSGWRTRSAAGRNDTDSYRTAWRGLHDALAAFPDRFIGIGSVSLDQPAERIATDIDQEVVGRGLRGIGELTPPPDGAARIEPVLRAAADRAGLPVVVHG